MVAMAKGYDVAWEVTVREIVAKRFSGLQISCPICQENGTLISKWVKGPPIKPLYVCHTDGNGYFKTCLLDKEDAKVARSKISITRNDILKTLKMGKLIVLFSGGKDSLCLLQEFFLC